MIPIRDWLEPHDAEYIDGLKELLENGHEEYETPLMIAVEPTDFIIEINHNKLYAHQEKIATLSPALNKKMKQYKEWKIKKLVQKSSKSSKQYDEDSVEENKFVDYGDDYFHLDESYGDPDLFNGDVESWCIALQLLYHPELLNPEYLDTFPMGGRTFEHIFHCIVFLGVENEAIIKPVRHFLEVRPNIACLQYAVLFNYCKKSRQHEILDFEKFLIELFSRYPEEELVQFRNFFDLPVDKQVQIFERRVQQLELLFKDPKILWKTHFRDQPSQVMEAKFPITTQKNLKPERRKSSKPEDNFYTIQLSRAHIDSIKPRERKPSIPSFRSTR